MSKLEVDAIEPQSGTTLTIGDSGDTIAIASGATLSGSISGITNLTMTGDLTINDGNKIQLTKNTVSAGDSLGIIEFHDEDGGTGANAGEFRIEGTRGDDKDSPNLKFIGADSGGVLQDRLVIQGTTGNVGIGTSSPSFESGAGGGLEVNYSAGLGAHLKLTDSASGSGGTNGFDLYAFNTSGYIENYEAGNIVFRNDGAERMRIDSGNLMIGQTTQSVNNIGVGIGTAGYIAAKRNSAAVLLINRGTNDGDLVTFRQDNTQEGAISVSGSTVTYGGFTGTHWSRFTDNSKPTILKGTVLESLDEMCDWYNLEFDVTTTTQDEDGNDVSNTENHVVPHVLQEGQSNGDVITYNHEGTDVQATIVKEKDIKHVKSKVSDTADAKNVYGVFVAYDEDGEGYNDFHVASVGSFVVRIKQGETVAKGDLLQSNGDGTAKVQTDDNVKSSSFAKVLSTTVIETYEDGSFLVPCSLMC